MAAPTQAYSTDFIPMYGYAGTTWGTGADLDAASLGIAPFYVGGFKRLHPGKNFFNTMNTTSVAYSCQGRYDDTTVTWQQYLAYEAGNLPIAQWFGDNTAPSTVETSGRAHVWDIQTRNNYYASFAESDTVTAAEAIWALDTVAVMGMELTLEPGQSPSMISFTGVASHCTLETNADSGDQPDTTTVASVTNATITQFACFEDVTFRINSQSGGALGSGDEINPGSIKVTFNRPFEADHRVKNSADGALFAKGPAAPRQTGPSEVMLELSFPSYDTQNDSFIEAIMDDDQGDEWKADITIDSGTLAGATSENYKHLIQFPRLQLDPSGSSVAEDAVEGGKATVLLFKCMTASSAPTGMSGVTNVRWTNTNQKTATYLT